MITCARETELWEAIAAGRWPETAPAELRAHLESCGTCREFAAVAGAVHADGVDARCAATPPTSAIAWWRAQMRARHEAAHAADRPITVAHALAVAAGSGLMVALMSIVVPWLRPFVIRLVQSGENITALPTLGFAQQWAPILAAALLMMAVLGPVALYLALADD